MQPSALTTLYQTQCVDCTSHMKGIGGVWVCVCVCVCACTRVCVRAYMHVRMCMCICVCMHMCVCMSELVSMCMSERILKVPYSACCMCLLSIVSWETVHNDSSWTASSPSFSTLSTITSCYYKTLPADYTKHTLCTVNSCL